MDKERAKEPRSAAAKFRRYFGTGLLVLAPLWLTVYVIVLVVRLLGGVLSPYFRITAHSLLGTEKWTGLVTTLADITAFIVTVIGITLIGMLVRRVVGQRMLKAVDALVRRIPVVREIYDSIRKFIDVFFGDKGNFRRVVAINFPTDKTWSIGFVTGENRIHTTEDTDEHMLSVFVPTAPNPTSGYLILAYERDVKPLSLTIDEAMKLIVSGGTMVPERFLPRE